MSGNLIAQEKNKEDFKKMADSYADEFPTITQVELQNKIKSGKKIYILDTRQIEEYNVSHIKNALFYGFKDPKEAILKDIPKDAEIIVYCSVGYRSGKVAKDLSKMGYTNIKNLYGGVFSWFNEGNELVDNNGKNTNKIHTYNEKWSKWINRGEKVY